MVDRHICGDAPCPGAEAAGRIESRMGPIDPPERFDGQIFGGFGPAYDTNDPSIHICLKLPEQDLEGLDITMRESLFRFISHLYMCFTGRRREWFIFL